MSHFCHTILYTKNVTNLLTFCHHGHARKTVRDCLQWATLHNVIF